MKTIIKKLISIFIIIAVIISCVSTGFAVSAKELTSSVAMQYYSASGGWKSFSGGVASATDIGALYIKTTASDYYLKYKVWNSGQSGWFSTINSNNGLPVSDSSAYAGSLKGSVIRCLNIEIANSSGATVTSGIYAMYRVKVSTGWYSWVCTGGYEKARYLAARYGIEGTLEKTDTYAGSSSKNVTAIEIRIFDERNITPSGNYKIIDAPHIYQMNGYPTGCESVSTVMALKHAGVNITVDSLIDNYLEKGDYTSFDPNICFGGDPRGTGMGCYSPVIKKACDKLLSGTDYYATEIKNVSVKELCQTYIDNGIPVIFWATLYMREAYNGRQITYNGKTFYWIAPEHCLLLVGYDDYYYIFNDPMETSKQVYYPKSLVETAYAAMGSQAVVIQKEEAPAHPETLPSVTDYEYRLGLNLPESNIGTVSLYDGSDTTSVPLYEFSNGFTVDAVYNSAALCSGSMGTGWSTVADKYLEVNGDTIKIYDNHTVYSVYKKMGEKYFACTTKGREDRSLSLTDSGYIVSNGEEYDLSGNLIAFIDYIGNLYCIEYQNGSLVITESESSEQVFFSFDDSGYLISAGASKLSYHGGYLMDIVAPSGDYSAAYGENGILSFLIKNDAVLFENTYDAYGRIISKNTDGVENYYSYSQNGIRTVKSGTASYTRQFENNAKLILSYGSDEAHKRFAYDDNGKLLSIVFDKTGDANSDGTVDLKDIIRLKYVIADPINCVYDADAVDINKDTSVDAIDVVLIKKYILGIDNGEIRCDFFNK